MDYITLTGVSAYGTHGVLDFEHAQPQKFVVDAVMYLDLSDASRSDDLADTVSYAQIADRIVSVIEGEHSDLIEHLAQRIADSILLSWRVKKTIVTVHKPQAPIEQEFGDVSVTVERNQKDFEENPAVSKASLHTARMREESLNEDSSAPSAHSEQSVQSADSAQPHIHTAVLALGGNIGDVEQTLRTAIVALDAIVGNQITGISALYTTKPWGVAGDVPDFKNAVVELTTVMDAQQLLNSIHMIEAAHGRTREVHWDSRPLDIDIIDFDGMESTDPALTLPHPRAWQRAFVLKPWLDINPDAQLSGPHGGRVSALAEAAPDSNYVQLESAQWILGGTA
ncbi:2-amino-4-hydroxy-6-hydroxymethyldihydropteridine diphosphokinase [Alloscardovia criceti]|uniref:2-amino-4-hydroxy-6- hydroxymethyldihydropteridine diphosphokinase n=1 Tax=Alloscardovia criceti TaxID=356828 RepID=UPI00036C38D6|nr:2-amino-4-hydroxy-6-hydroxymethyldihydropteridine diphosphokinase [Alloscardovia criceti]